MQRFNIIDLIFYPIMKALGKQLPKCERCKVKMEKQNNPRLFLLPVYFGNNYAASSEYYISNCVAINTVHQIPTGQRACRFWQLVCPQCGKRMVLVEDFLRVRDTEAVEKRELYDATELAKLL